MKFILETDSQNNVKIFDISKGIDYLIRVFDMQKSCLLIEELKYLNQYIENYKNNRISIEEKIKNGEIK